MNTLKLGTTVDVIDSIYRGVVSSIITVEKTGKWKSDCTPVDGWLNDAVETLTLDEINLDKCFYFVELDNDINKIFDLNEVRPVDQDLSFYYRTEKIVLESDKIRLKIEADSIPYYKNGINVNICFYYLVIKDLNIDVAHYNEYSLYAPTSCTIDPQILFPGIGTKTVYDLAPNLPDYIWDEMGRLLASN